MKYPGRNIVGAAILGLMASVVTAQEPGGKADEKSKFTPAMIANASLEDLRRLELLGRQISSVTESQAVCACGHPAVPSRPPKPPRSMDKAAVQRAINLLQAVLTSYKTGGDFMIRSGQEGKQSDAPAAAPH